MTKRYLAISNWVDKETGEPKTSLGEITEGISKKGNGYQITDTEKTMTVNECIPVGTIVTSTMTLDIPAPAPAPSAKPDKPDKPS
jgi:hypothetical protein